MEPPKRLRARLVLTLVFAGFARVVAAQQTSQTQAGRPIPPRLALAVSAVRCEYGGAIPGVSVFFDASTPTALTALRPSSLMIATASGGWALASDGALDIRTWSGPLRAPGSSPVPFDGSVAVGRTLHFQVFARLSLTAFGPGASYPNAQRRFQLVLQPAQGVYVLAGPPCVVTPAG